MFESRSKHVILYVDNGVVIKRRLARIDSESEAGEVVVYRNGRGRVMAVVSRMSQPRLERGYRAYYLYEGEPRAREFGCSDCVDLPIEVISELQRGSLVVKLARSFAGGGLDMKWILIVGGVLAVGVVIYMLVGGSGSPEPLPIDPNVIPEVLP